MRKVGDRYSTWLSDLHRKIRETNGSHLKRAQDVFSVKTFRNHFSWVWVVKVGCCKSRAASRSCRFTPSVGLSASLFCWPDEPKANPVFCWVRLELAPRSNEPCRFTSLGCLLAAQAGSVAGMNLASTGFLVDSILTLLLLRMLFKELQHCDMLPVFRQVLLSNIFIIVGSGSMFSRLFWRRCKAEASYSVKPLEVDVGLW